MELSELKIGTFYGIKETPFILRLQNITKEGLLGGFVLCVLDNSIKFSRGFKPTGKGWDKQFPNLANGRKTLLPTNEDALMPEIRIEHIMDEIPPEDIPLLKQQSRHYVDYFFDTKSISMPFVHYRRTKRTTKRS
jgi:hypothetical protein